MKTEIIALLDRSDSMNDIASDAIGGFNSFVNNQQAQEGDAKLSLVLFDHDYEVVYQGLNIQEAPQLNSQTFIPRGSTALLDALGRTIFEQRARIEKEMWAELVIFCILTDGLENASKEFSSAQIKMLITTLQKENGWSFIYLAANQDAFEVGEQYGIRKDYTANFEATSEGTVEVYAMMSETSTRIRKKKSRSA